MSNQIPGHLFNAYKDKYVILFFDKDCGLYFTIIAEDKERDHIMLYPEDVAKRIVKDHRFRMHWIDYEYEIHRYEALKEFEDYHRRRHWAFDHLLVQFFGTAEQMDWISTITARGNHAIDPKTGLVLDWESVPKPGLTKRLRAD